MLQKPSVILSFPCPRSESASVLVVRCDNLTVSLFLILYLYLYIKMPFRSSLCSRQTKLRYSICLTPLLLATITSGHCCYQLSFRCQSASKQTAKHCFILIEEFFFYDRVPWKLLLANHYCSSDIVALTNLIFQHTMPIISFCMTAIPFSATQSHLSAAANLMPVEFNSHHAVYYTDNISIS